MSVLMGPAPCITCRTWLYLLADRRWYEPFGVWHSAMRCLVARERAA